MTQKSKPNETRTGQEAQTTRHILCPNDKDILAALEPRILHRRGIKVHPFVEGKEALELAREIPPSLCITRQSMEDMEARDLAARLHEMHGEEFLPLVLLIGENESDPGPLDPRYFAGSLPLPPDAKTLSVLLGKLMGVHLREAERFPIRVRVFSDEYVGTTLDLSSKGMLVRTDKAMEPSSTVEIRFALPGSSRRLAVEAQVVRSDKKLLAPDVAVAFRFTPLPFSQRQHLESYISSLVSGRTFGWDKSINGDRTYLRLSGRLRNSDDLLELAAETVGPVELNLTDLKKIDPSCFDTWRGWLRGLCQIERPVSISSVSYTLGQQFSRDPALFEGASVRSVAAAHVCEECEAERIFPVPVTSDARPPSHECPVCGGQMSLDEPIPDLPVPDQT